MEHIQRLYAAWIRNAPVVLSLSGVLLVASILISGLRGQVSVENELSIYLLRGNVIYGSFLSALLVLVYIGWRFDNQPGRTITVALIAALVGSIVRLLFPLAMSGGWMPVWSGLMLGIFIVTLYVSWQVRARFAMITVVIIIYTMLVTAGFVLGIQNTLSAPVFIGFAVIGGYTFCLACITCDRIIMNLRNARRDALDQHIHTGALQSIRPVMLWGAEIFLLALPAVVMGSGPFRSLGVLFLIGAIAGVYAILAFPVPLMLATRGLSGPPESERSGRRESRRRRSS